MSKLHLLSFVLFITSSVTLWGYKVQVINKTNQALSLYFCTSDDPEYWDSTNCVGPIKVAPKVSNEMSLPEGKPTNYVKGIIGGLAINKSSSLTPPQRQSDQQWTVESQASVKVVPMVIQK